jgi:hypothetical protein
MESQFRRDFGQVRLHTGPTAAALSEQIGARAFTHGSDIFFGKHRPEPGTGEDTRLLAHELTHVVQQTGSGAVQAKPEVQRDGEEDSAKSSGGSSGQAAAAASSVQEEVEHEEDEEDDDDDDEDEELAILDHGTVADAAITYDQDVTTLLRRPITLKKQKTLYRQKNKSDSRSSAHWRPAAPSRSWMCRRRPRRGCGRAYRGRCAGSLRKASSTPASASAARRSPTRNTRSR